ncbi:hypothetical protein PWG15_20790 (plasmid) [Ensifer adhaerens]|uniref:hypothetical protein n=1 Tax=Ensifer adhaerens TaxID=106592 RepID=UPI0023A98B51|nr:hypothetical protein [Ensifer adhaerens]WDZ80239.1 hypothetical protein PWG15_20790 [Ensifer adhaerens]
MASVLSNSKNRRALSAVLPVVDTSMTAGRGRGKISATDAVKAILDALEQGPSRIHVGKARLLRLLEIVAPPVAAAIVRRL